MATNMILFENQTYYSVEVLLIESNSRETLMNFGILRPKSLMMANSYETFTWLFRECTTKSEILVAGNELSNARPWTVENKCLQFQSAEIPIGTLIVIQPPVLDLKQLCLLQLTSMLRTEDAIRTLEIPATLQNELSEMISIRHRRELYS